MSDGWSRETNDRESLIGIITRLGVSPTLVRISEASDTSDASGSRVSLLAVNHAVRDAGRVGAADEPMVRIRVVRDRASEPMSWRSIGELDWSEYGLVLGAGGATGAAFEAGLLLALSVDHRVSLDGARSVVGTSAGSIGSALLSIGFGAEDIAALVAESYEHISVRAGSWSPGLLSDVPMVPSMLRMFRNPSPRLAAATMCRLVRRQYVASFLQLFRAGQFDFLPRLDFLADAAWASDRSVRICATELDTGRLRVFDRDDDVSLAAAVAASCAVPGVMLPTMIGGRPFVDGGAVSPTNAHLLAGPGGPGLVLILSPMSGSRSRTITGVASSHFAANRLAAELHRFAPHQTVVVVEPIGHLSELVTDDALDTSRSRQVLSRSFATASL